MSVIRTSALGDFTRGGQTTLHFIRMIFQVLTQFSKFILGCFLLFWGSYSWMNTSPYQHYLVPKTSMVWVLNRLELSDHRLPFRLPGGRVIQTRVGSILHHRGVHQELKQVLSTMVNGMVWGMTLLGLGVLLLGLFIQRTGRHLRQEQFIRGVNITSTQALKQLLKDRQELSNIKIDQIPLLKNAETSHTLITGSPGSGKSVAIRHLLEQIRKQGDRAIVYSTAGEFIENFYREGQDVVLNPLDERCPPWHLWAECTLPSDYDSIAASMIPQHQNQGDPFWVLAGRTLLSCMAFGLHQRGIHDTRQLLHELLTQSIEASAQLIQGTEGASLLDKGAEKTALSVRATLASYLRSLKFLNHPKGSEAVFSIKQWVQNERNDAWVFIASRPDQKETLRPLITTWLDVATNALLSLEPDLNRRIWLIIDELPSLNKLPSLSELLAQSRKFGGCCVLGFQSYSQLADIYGNRGAEAITGLCSTWLCYRANEPTTAEWASKSLGSGEVMETSEGISYGAHEMRDGLSLSISSKVKPLVLPSQIMNLPNLEGYVRLPGDLPVARFKLNYKALPQVAQAYLPCDISRFEMGLPQAIDKKSNPLNTNQFSELLHEED